MPREILFRCALLAGGSIPSACARHSSVMIDWVY